MFIMRIKMRIIKYLERVHNLVFLIRSPLSSSRVHIGKLNNYKNNIVCKIRYKIRYEGQEDE
jgi:hypothetical protein